MRKTVRLSDIAKRLDVSTVTVSNALSGQKGVSDELRDKIRSTAAEMGYKTKRGTVVVERTKTLNICVIIADKYLGSYPSFYWKAYQEFCTAAKNKNCMVLYEVLKQEDEENLVLPLSVEGKNADGIAVIGEVTNEYLSFLIEKSDMPVVLVDFVKKDIFADAVISDNFYGMYHTVNYLIENGHRNIAYVGTVLANNSITDRYFGYCKALMENNIPLRKDWVIADRGFTGRMEIDRLSLPKEMPTAFACNSDLTASELIKLLAQNGYKVPEDISIVGYDNYLYTGLCDVKITTYEVNVEAMVKVAIDKLVNRLKHHKKDIEMTRIVTGKMVIKDSVRRM